MTRAARLLAGLFCAAGLSLAAKSAHAEAAGCSAPPAAMEASPLPGTATALFQGGIRILVVGSASTAGGGTSGPEATWPQRLARGLRMRLDGVEVDMLSLGGRGTTAADHARLLAERGPAFRPNLVIWQLGTVEAARGLSAEEMAETVQATAARIRARRGESVDLVLMDPQFSRFLRANADVETYREKLRIAAFASGAQLFSRWDIMLAWAESERLDLERAPRARRVATADELHDCLARALIEFLLSGTR
jgi:hypothetical protein